MDSVKLIDGPHSLCILTNLDRNNDGLTPLEARIDELKHRLKIEKAVQDGARNVIRSLQSTKGVDKKALQEVCQSLKWLFPIAFACCGICWLVADFTSLLVVTILL